MLDPGLKGKLINKINETNDPFLLEEISNLFELQESQTIYEVTDLQKKAIEESREQIIKKETLTDDEAKNDIDEWLNK